MLNVNKDELNCEKSENSYTDVICRLCTSIVAHFQTQQLARIRTIMMPHCYYWIPPTWRRLLLQTSLAPHVFYTHCCRWKIIYSDAGLCS